MYQQRVEEISPNMRYCAYNIGDMPTDINQLMEMRNVSDMLASKINVGQPYKPNLAVAFLLAHRREDKGDDCCVSFCFTLCLICYFFCFFLAIFFFRCCYFKLH